MMKKITARLWLSGSVIFWSIVTTAPTQAQIAEDRTLATPTRVQTSDNRNFNITGGSQRGENLFHSFREFSVPVGGLARFNNDETVGNIIGRVTGNSISNIEGAIAARGNANLFLINPNGIIFGSNASLQIGGSFIASTADSLVFQDGTRFSATTQTAPLLTIGVPVGLQFGQTPGAIRNSSLNLAVQPNKTLAMVGGLVTLERGRTFAPAGRIELGSIVGLGFVSLTPINRGFRLGYQQTNRYQDIRLSQAASVDTTDGSGSGDIFVRGRQISLSDGSLITNPNSGIDRGGVISLQASELVEITNGSGLSTASVNRGAAGQIIIEAQKLLVSDNSIISALNAGVGAGGNITVNASDLVEIDGNGEISQLTTQAFATGNAGSIEITTRKLLLRNGGQITSSTLNEGNGGTVTVNASQSVEVIGQGEFNGEVVRSGLFAQSAGELSQVLGKEGNISVNTERLVIRDGGTISVSSIEREQEVSDTPAPITPEQFKRGQAGTLTINAAESVEIFGTGSTLAARSELNRPAGDLIVNTDRLLLRDGAQISVSSLQGDRAGNLEVTARSLELDNGTNLIAESDLGDGGNIILKLNDFLLLRRRSQISTTAGREGTVGNGGNIEIDTPFAIAIPTENSDITANAFEGRGGNINLTAQGIFGIEFRDNRTPFSDITASSEFGIDGIVTIEDPDVDAKRNVEELPETPVDVSKLVNQNLCKAGVGSEFIITGRGGLPDSPNEALSADAVWEDWRISQEGDRSSSAQLPVSLQPIVEANPQTITEAQGWIKNSQGKIVLTTDPVASTPSYPIFWAEGCYKN
jgi:filamentous hemagglutinin family protein